MKSPTSDNQTLYKYKSNLFQTLHATFIIVNFSMFMLYVFKGFLKKNHLADIYSSNLVNLYIYNLNFWKF